MRTNIVINDSLIRQAMTLSGLPTKKQTVEEGLRLLIQVKRQQRIRKLRGKSRWEGDLEGMRRDR